MLHALFPFSWAELLMPKPSWGEKLLRPVLIYLALFLIFRFASKRELAQATMFDFLIILMISNVVQNAMIGEDNSVLGATGGAIVLVLLSGLLNRVTARNKKMRILLEGKPVLLIHNGRVDDRAMHRQAISRNDLFSAVRKQGIGRLEEVGYAILELDGTISVIRADEHGAPYDCLPPEIVGAESQEEREAPPPANDNRLS